MAGSAFPLALVGKRSLQLADGPVMVAAGAATISFLVRRWNLYGDRRTRG